jgi:hypothetical protein
VSVNLNVILVRLIERGGRKVRIWSLAATKNYKDPCDAVRDYRLRWQIEERYKQIKSTWLCKGFNSTSFNLVVAHILFTLLVYSFIQIYLNINRLNDLANRTMEALRYEESLEIMQPLYMPKDIMPPLIMMKGCIMLRFLKENL